MERRVTYLEVCQSVVIIVDTIAIHGTCCSISSSSPAMPTWIHRISPKTDASCSAAVGDTDLPHAGRPRVVDSMPRPTRNAAAATALKGKRKDVLKLGGLMQIMLRRYANASMLLLYVRASAQRAL